MALFSVLELPHNETVHFLFFLLGSSRLPSRAVWTQLGLLLEQEAVGLQG